MLGRSLSRLAARLALGAGAASSAAAVAACASAAEPAVRPPADAADALSADELRTIAVFEASCDSVVFVTNVRAQQPSWFSSQPLLEAPGVAAGSGSGFVWDRDGHIVTNYHVIQGATELTVTTASQEIYRAELVGIDIDRDIAVLRVRAAQPPLAPLPLGASSRLRVGQRTLAIGCPFGLDHTLTTGIVSGLGRDMMGRTGRPICGVVQTDAALNPGSSGGPLLDSSGRVIGVNTAILTTSGGNAGVGMSIPIDSVKLSVEQIIAHGHVVRPSLGVRMAPDHFVQHRLGLSGVLVFELQPGGGAERAGLRGTTRSRAGHLQLGDVIVRVNSKDVKNSLDLYKAMEDAQVGDSVELELLTLEEDGRGLRETGRRKAKVQVGGLASSKL